MNKTAAIFLFCAIFCVGAAHADPGDVLFSSDNCQAWVDAMENEIDKRIGSEVFCATSDKMRERIGLKWTVTDLGSYNSPREKLVRVDLSYTGKIFKTDVFEAKPGEDFRLLLDEIEANSQVSYNKLFKVRGPLNTSINVTNGNPKQGKYSNGSPNLSGEIVDTLCGVTRQEESESEVVADFAPKECFDDSMEAASSVVSIYNPKQGYFSRDENMRKNYPTSALEKLSFKYLNPDEEYTPDFDDPTKVLPFQNDTDRIANIFLGLDNLAGEIKSNTKVVKGVATGDLVASLTGTLAAGGALVSGLYKVKPAKENADPKAVAEAAGQLDNTEALSILSAMPEEENLDEDEESESEPIESAAAKAARTPDNAEALRILSTSPEKQSKKQKPQLTKQEKTEKRLNNMRTGLLFASGFTNLASALVSGFTNNKWKGPEETLNYYKTYNRWRDILDAEKSKTNEPKMRMLIQSVLNDCEPYNIKDMEQIIKNMKAANILGYVSAATGTAGGISSAIAGSKKLKASEKASAPKTVKNANMAANVFSGVTAAVGITQVGVSADMVARLNRNIKRAEACKKTVANQMAKNADLMKRVRQTDPRRYLQRGEKENYPYRNIVRLTGGCTGMLVTPNLILTADHCVKGADDPQINYDFQYGAQSKASGAVVWHREMKDEDAALIRVSDSHKSQYPDYYSGPFPDIAPAISNQDFNLLAAGYGEMRVIPDYEFETVKEIIAIVMSRNPDYYKEAYGKFLNSLIGKQLRKYDAVPSALHFAMNEEAEARGIKKIFGDHSNLKVQEDCSILSQSSATLMSSQTSPTDAKLGDLGIVYQVKTDCMIVNGNSGGPLLYKKSGGGYGLTGIVSTASGYKYGNNTGAAGGMYIRPEAYYQAILAHDK